MRANRKTVIGANPVMLAAVTIAAVALAIAVSGALSRMAGDLTLASQEAPQNDVCAQWLRLHKSPEQIEALKAFAYAHTNGSGIFIRQLDLAGQ